MLLPYSFLRPFIAFAIGIVGGVYLPLTPNSPTLVLCIITLVYSAIHLFSSPTFKRQAALLFAVFSFILTMAFGYVYTLHRTAQLDTNHLVYYKDTLQYYEVVLTSEIKKTSRGDKAEASIRRICTDTIGLRWQYATGKVMLYFEGINPEKMDMDYGSRLIIKGFPTDIPSPMNPDEFDYHNYMANLQIHHYHFIFPKDYVVIGKTVPNYVQYWSIAARKYCDNILRRFITDHESYGLATALVLGIKENLSDELKNSYSNSGIMHILAVSGMHVTLLFSIISVLLKSWVDQPRYKPYVLLFSLVLLWFYAFITGLSASVLRAVVMFTILLLAKWLDRKYNIYNVLAMAALAMCLIDPYILFDVGFQLSYLAVLGIVFFHPIISRLYIPAYPSRKATKSIWVFRWGVLRHWVINNIWVILTVSVAAQITTSPIGLLYFHQFPNYFLLANLVAIPLSTLVMYTELVLLTFHWLPFIGITFGWLTEKLIISLNYVVSLIEQLPYALTSGIHITAWETWAIYTIIVLLVLFFYRKQLVYFGIATFIFGCVAVGQYYEFLQQYHQQQILFYQTPRASAIELTDGNTAYFIGHKDLINNAQKIRFHTYNTQFHRGVQEVRYFYADDSTTWQPYAFPHHPHPSYRLICFRGQKIVYLHKKMWLHEIPTADFWVIAENAFPKISKRHHTHNKVGKIVIDGSNGLRATQRFTTKLDSLHLPYHTTAIQGALVHTITP